MPRSIKRGLETAGLYSNRYMTEALTAKIRASSHNLESLHFLPSLGLPFVPQTSFALCASAIRIILNDIVLHQRRCVVELGSGISTLFLSKVLHDRPGSLLISVDHDANWLACIASQLKRIGTASAVRLVHAPLEPSPGNDDVLWYSHGLLKIALERETVDAVIVDGPKALHENDSETRSHALPFLFPRLNHAGAVVFMDDIRRNGERQIYAQWAEEFTMEPVRDAEFCGLGILVPRAHPLRFRIV